MKPILFLQKLITDETPILELKNDVSISRQQKYQVLGLPSSSLTNRYIERMYYQNLKWFYFKSEESRYGYPFSILDELMGSYLAKIIELPAVSFVVAKTKDSIGIASENFRMESSDYYFIQQLPVKTLLENRFNLASLDILKSLCIDPINAVQLEEHILKLLALDLYMLQKDRGDTNLQFQINHATQYLDLSAVYDFSNCIEEAELASVMIRNPIVVLNYNTIRLLIKKYPKFTKYIESLQNQTMCSTWDQICGDYHFNLNCFAYNQAKNHYEIKDQKQKGLFKELFTNV